MYIKCWVLSRLKIFFLSIVSTKRRIINALLYKYLPKYQTYLNYIEMIGNDKICIWNTINYKTKYAKLISKDVNGLGNDCHASRYAINEKNKNAI